MLIFWGILNVVLDRWLRVYIVICVVVILGVLTLPWYKIVLVSLALIAIGAASFSVIEPAFVGLFLRFGKRIVTGEKWIQYQIINGEKIVFPVFDEHQTGTPDIYEEVQKEYRTKDEGWRFIFPGLERIVKISLRPQYIEINARAKDEKDEDYRARAESFTTIEGVHIFPEIPLVFKITKSGSGHAYELGIEKNGESPRLRELVHDIALGSARDIFGPIELTKILSRTIEENGKKIPVGETIKRSMKSTPNWYNLGIEIILIRVEDIKFAEDAKDVLNQLEAIKKEKLEKEKKLIEAEKDYLITVKKSEGLLVQKQNEALGISAMAQAFRNQILGFIGKKLDDVVTKADYESYANYLVNLERAKSLALNTKVVIVPNDGISAMASGLSQLIDVVKQK